MGLNDEKSTTSPDLVASISKQMIEAAAAYRDFETRFQQAIAEVGKRFSNGLQGVVGAIAQIDWAEIDRKATEELLNLARLGWTVAPWMTLPQVTHLSNMNTDDLDQEFTRLYFEYGGLDHTKRELIPSAHTQRWRPLLVQVFAALDRGEYLVAIPALLSMLEGFVAQFVDNSDTKLVGTTNVLTLMNAIRSSGADSRIIGRLWTSTAAFLSQLYKRAPFSEDRPSFVNRHWILHGRDVTDWTTADALRILNAIGTLHWLMTASDVPV